MTFLVAKFYMVTDSTFSEKTYFFQLKKIVKNNFCNLDFEMLFHTNVLHQNSNSVKKTS